MNKIAIAIVVSALCIQGCKKENKINKNLEGTWTVKEYSLKNGLYNDFSNETRTFEFSKYKKAYTRTMKGVYKVTYTDPAKQPVVDTFEYQLKDRMLEITYVQNKRVNGVSPNTVGFLRRRFLLSNSASSEFTLTRVDSTNLYIRATK